MSKDLHLNCQFRNANFFFSQKETTKRYFIETFQRTWREAQNFCRQYHTDLASVRSQTENEQIQDIINNTETPVWIGLFSDPWEWPYKSESGFRNWDSKEPNNPDSSEVCMEVRMNEGLWNDVGCHHSLTFVCHKGAVKVYTC